MAGFGFIPNDPDDSENSGENGRPDFEAMMRQMQEQMKAQFEQLGINPAGFVNPFTSLFSQVGKTNSGADGKEEVLSITTARDTASKFVKAQGSKPLGTKDVSVVESAFEIFCDPLKVKLFLFCTSIFSITWSPEVLAKESLKEP